MSDRLAAAGSWSPAAEEAAIRREVAGSPNATYGAVRHEQAMLDVERCVAAREQGLADLLRPSLEASRRALGSEAGSNGVPLRPLRSGAG